MPGVCYLQLFLVVLTSDILRCNIPSFNVTILHLYLFRLSVLSLGSFLYLLLDFFFFFNQIHLFSKHGGKNFSV